MEEERYVVLREGRICEADDGSDEANADAEEFLQRRGAPTSERLLRNLEIAEAKIA